MAGSVEDDMPSTRKEVGRVVSKRMGHVATGRSVLLTSEFLEGLHGEIKLGGSAYVSVRITREIVVQI
jgi:hypothetical protein